MSSWKGFIRNKKKGSLITTTEVDVFVVEKPQGANTETDPTVPSHVKTITTEDITNWVTGFNNNIISGSITGDINKILTLTKRNGSTLSIPFTDISGEIGDDVINTLSFNSSTGVLTAVTSEGIQITTNLDGRYALLNHTHNYENPLTFVGQGATSVTRSGNTITISSTNSGTYTPKRGTVLVTESIILSAALHDQMTLVCKNTVDITITIPTGLGTDFDCNVLTEDIGSRWVKFVAGVGMTLIAPHGTKLLTDYTANITKRTGMERVNIQGELTP